MTDAQTYGGVQWSIDYSAASGDFPGSSSAVECSNSLPSAFPAYDDREGSRTLVGAVISLVGFAGPAEVASCRFVATGPVAPGDFPIAIEDANDPAGNPIAGMMSTDVVCAFDSTTTTTTFPEPLPCEVTMELTSSGNYGTLQYHADYSGTPGEFPGTGGGVDCTNLVAGALSAFNDQDANRLLQNGVISLSVFTGPRDLATCRFNANAPITGSDFVMAVDDSLDIFGSPIPATVQARVDCPSGTTTTTTTSTSSTTTTSSSTTTSTMPAVSCSVTLHLEDDVTLGSIGLEALAAEAAGFFESGEGQPICSGYPVGSLPAASLDDADQTLRVALISIGGMDGPLDLATCNFIATPRAEPEDFEVTVTDAADTAVNPVEGLTVTARTNGCHPQVCGDGFTDAPEQCDDEGESASCDADCTIVECGDGITNTTAGESCDTEGASSECDADCTPAVCGDGTVNPFNEESCDDGGESAACDANCTDAECGDATLNVTAGETCDDGGDSAECDADCTPAECGDETVNPAASEDCDEGAGNSDDRGVWCTATCGATPCGTPVSRSQTFPTSTDALWALQTAVGLQFCDRRVCDANSSGGTTATDALLILNVAVRNPASLNCPVEL